MNNKKIFGLGLVLASVGLLAACGENSSSSSKSSSIEPTSSSQTSGGPVIPVEEGKTTFYFHFHATDGVASLASHNSPFMTGAFNGWGTTPTDDPATSALEFTKLADSDIYYAQVANTQLYDDAGNYKSGFQLTLGWNASSNAPVSQQGINWSYKSEYCALYTDGTEHPVFSAPENNLVNLSGASAIVPIDDAHKPVGDDDAKHMADPAAILDYQSFASQPAAVKTVENFTVKFKINLKDDVAIPSYLEFFATGGFNGWKGEFEGDNAAVKLVKGADDYYTLNFGTCYNQVPVEWMIVAAAHKSAGGYGNAFWDYKVQDANITTVPLKALEGEVLPLDPFVFERWPGDPDQVLSHEIKLVLSSGTMPEEGVVPHIAGNLNGWTHEPMTLADDQWSYTIPAGYTIGADVEFCVTNGTWDSTWKLDGQNIKFAAEEGKDLCVITGDLAALGHGDSACSIEYKSSK